MADTSVRFARQCVDRAGVTAVAHRAATGTPSVGSTRTSSVKLGGTDGAGDSVINGCTGLDAEVAGAALAGSDVGGLTLAEGDSRTGDATGGLLNFGAGVAVGSPVTPAVGVGSPVSAGGRSPVSAGGRARSCCSGRGGVNTARSSRCTSGAGSTARTPGRTAIRSSAAGVDRTIAA
jgi:hypothetical protein